MAKLYKGTPPVGFLDKIELILRDAYKAEDQATISETNIGENGKEFTMSRSLKCAEGYKYLLYKFDYRPGDSKFPFPYFELHDSRGVSLGVAKVCDYALFIENAGNTYIVLIELKNGRDNPKPQLEQTKFFIEFMQQRADYAGIDIDAEIRMVGISDVVTKEYTKAGVKVEYKNGFAQLYSGRLLRISELAK